MFKRGNLSRRGFLQSSLAGLTAAGLPLWHARELLAAEEAAAAKKAVAANDKLNVGIMGIDNNTRRSVALYGEAKRVKGVQFVAACDVDANHLKNGLAMMKKDGFDAKGYTDFRELLQNKDIDAVIVAVPDQWHALIAIEAMKRGKDIYSEKPLTLTINEGKKMVEAQKKYARVFQTGSQQRTEMGAKFRLATEIARSGRIGKIGRIECRIGRNPQSGPIAKAKAPEGLDWDMWLGPCPKTAYYYEKRGRQAFTNCHYEYRWWFAYSGGKMTDWGAHHLDIAQWVLGMDGNGPIEVSATSSKLSKADNEYNCPEKFEVTYTYANGAMVLAMSDGDNGVKIDGEGGKWIFVSRGAIKASDPKILSEPLPKDFKALYPSKPVSHMQNFVDCVRSRKETICPVTVGHSSVTVCHIGNISTRLGRALKWDPIKQEFVGDADANTWLSREMRAPWKIEV